MKINRLITKRCNPVNTKETNKMEKQTEEVQKYKDASSRIFKAIKDFKKMKPKTHLLIKKEGNQIYSK